LLAAAALVSAGVTIAGPATAETTTFPGGATLDVTISSPNDGSSVSYGTDVQVSGTATLSGFGGTGTGGTPPPPDTVLVTVVDLSGSTVNPSGATSCGNPNADGYDNSVLDCEITAAKALNASAQDAGTIGEVGVVGFAQFASAADVEPPAHGGNIVTGPSAPSAGSPFVNVVFDSMRAPGVINQFTPITNLGSYTNYGAALNSSVDVFDAATLTKRIVVFMSDGVPQVPGNVPSGDRFPGVLSHLPADTVVYTFAVGADATCAGNPSQPSWGSLQQIAAATGGTCSHILNPGDLPDVLPQVIKPSLGSLTLSVDSGSPTPVQANPALPVSGPASVDFTADVGTGLTPGTHTLCVTGTGSDNGGAGQVSDCVSITVQRAASRISTLASGDFDLGSGTLSDSATVTGQFPPTGAVTFDLYGPEDPTCAGNPLDTVTGLLPPGDDLSKTTTTPDSYSPDRVGTYRWVASYSGDANNAPAGGSCGDPSETTAVHRAEATISTTASQSVTLGDGTAISDSATVSGHQPTGTVTFKAYGPDDAVCAGPAAFTSTVDLSGGTATSGSWVPDHAGTYRWVASYSGDDGNTGVSAGCGEDGESVDVAKASPTMSTRASAGTVVGDGGTIHDVATLDGGVNPTGPVTFTLYGPDDPNCTDSSVQMQATLDGNIAVSPTYLPHGAGTYHWVASFPGDRDNEPASGGCGDAGETVVVAKAEPAIATTATEFALFPGNPISDTATVTGGYHPTGEVTFDLYRADGTGCAAQAVFSVSVPLGQDGTAASGDYTPSEPGVYRWVAGYSGDHDNKSVSGACEDPGETSIVGKATPSIGTLASADVPVGGHLRDTATVSGGYEPTGDVSFALYGPGDSTCSAAPVYAATASLDGSTAVAPRYTATAPGTYHWVATYNGDDFNESVAGACGDPGESVTVSPQVLTGRAVTLDITGNVLGLPVWANAQDTGHIATSSSATYDENCVDLDAAIVSATAICSKVVTKAGYPARSTATSTVASATVGLSLVPTIVVKAVQAVSTTSCAASAGSTTIAYLKVGSTVVIGAPTQVAPNTVVTVGAVRLVLNEQVPFSTPDAGMTVNAVHATANLLLAKADIVIASAESDIGNCPGG
jgi:hypothetical protein